MAVYRLSTTVRMRRGALRMTRLELIEIRGEAETEAEDNEICSVDTLKRIENGKVTRVKSEVYTKIMRKMGALPERIYASLFVMNPQALNLKAEIHIHICFREYEQAEKKLKKLEPMLIPDYPRNQQYLMEKKAVLAYKQGELTAEKYLERLLDALRLTVPMFDKIDIAEWPFNENEMDILSDIGNAYHWMGKKDEEFQFLLKLKENVEKKYMDPAHYVVWHMRALTGLSQLMCMENKHEESLEYCRVGIEECKKWRILGSVSDFLYDTVWNREQQIREGLFTDGDSPEKEELLIKNERASCRKQLVQAYFLSVAQGDVHQSERIKKLYENLYPEEAKLP